MKRIQWMTSVCLVLTLVMSLFTGISALADDEEIVLRVVDWSDSSTSQREAFHEAFEANHPGVKIEYTCLTVDQFASSVVSLISSGDAPDLFPIPTSTGMTLKQAVDDNWYVPLDDYVTDEFKSTMKDICFQEGVTEIDGKWYTIPEMYGNIHTLFFYNKDVLELAGVTELPTTYEEFAACCKQVTEAGNGEYYGLIEGGNQVNRLGYLLTTLAAYSGGKVAEYNQVVTDNGVCTFDCQEMLDAFAMLKQLYDDGSLHPDTLNISAPEARELFAQGKAAFLCQGMWCIATWAETYPDLNYGVMAPPKSSEDAVGAIQQPTGGAWLGIYSGSEYPELAAEYLMDLYSDTEDYHFQADCVKAGERVSVVKNVTEEYMTNPIMMDYYNTIQATTVAVPHITTRDLKYYDFYSEVIGVTPSMASILQGVWSGSVTDYESALHNLADANTAEWKRACEAVGLSFDGLEFDNWVVGTPYTAEDYEALPQVN